MIPVEYRAVIYCKNKRLRRSSNKIWPCIVVFNIIWIRYTRTLLLVFLGNHIRNEVPDLTKRLTPVQMKKVAFTAYLDKKISHLGINHPIPFDKVLINDGNALNVHTGIFLCPQSGVYLFTFNIESVDSRGLIVVKLVIDGVNQLDATASAPSGATRTDAMGGNTAIVRVTAGQSVWVATYDQNDVELWNAGVFRYTSFSGVFLYA